MISGTDDRIAFVIDTEARLDGIRNARSEVRGLGTDSTASAQRMAAASKSQAQSVLENTSSINMNIGAFQKRGEMVDRTSASAIRAYRAEGDALSANLARLGATEQELNKIGAAIAKLEMKAGALSTIGPQLGPALPPGGIIPPRAEEQLKRIPPHARSAANALSMLSSAAIYGTGSINGMLVASGGLATGLASLSKSASVAAAASGIGAIVTVAGIAALALYNMGKSAQVSQMQLDNLKNFSADTVMTNLAQIRAARDQALEDAVAAADAGYLTRLGKMLTANLATKEGRALLVGGGADFSALDKANQLSEAATKIALEKVKAERLRVLAMTDQMNLQIAINARQIEGQTGAQGILDVVGRQTYELYTQEDLEAKRIRASFIVRDANGHILALTGAQTRQMDTLLEQNVKLTDLQAKQIKQAKEIADEVYRRTTATSEAAGGNLWERHQDRLAQIEAEAKADIKAGRDKADVEAMTAAKIRAMRRETAKQAAQDANTLTSVLISSGSKQIRAVGHAADTIRRVVIGAQAAHAAVESAIEAGKAIGSAAAMDWRGAALHGMAALELAKAAALGAQESLGGGRGASGGGGAGSGGGGSTFEPRNSTEGQGSLVVNLFSQNPYGAEQIQSVQYLLNRAEILKRPAAIQIAPTNGIRAA